MIIPNNINFEELALEVLDLCPANKSDSFMNGYIEFTSAFANEINLFWKGAFGYPGGSFRFEAEINSQNIYELLQTEMRDMDLKNIEEFKTGAQLAEALILRKLLFYLNLDERKIA